MSCVKYNISVLSQPPCCLLNCCGSPQHRGSWCRLPRDSRPYFTAWRLWEPINCWLVNCCPSSPAQLFLVPTPTGLTTLFYCKMALETSDSISPSNAWARGNLLHACENWDERESECCWYAFLETKTVRCVLVKKQIDQRIRDNPSVWIDEIVFLTTNSHAEKRQNYDLGPKWKY
jgi:hypothetical protein